MNRRTFFQRTVGALVAGIAARYVPKGPAAAVEYECLPLTAVDVFDETEFTWTLVPADRMDWRTDRANAAWTHYVEIERQLR